MTPERFREVDRLVSLALERGVSERAPFLDNACGVDQELRAEVESLLACHEQAGSFLAEPAADLAAQLVITAESEKTQPARAEVEPELGSGSRLGRYLVRGKLGSGGMGLVYEAHDPELNRKLAIKLMRPQESESISASDGRVRLMREAQAMARLAHPNVIAIHDVGTFGEQVFIAMEHVEGQTLTQWLAERARSWRQIAAMFLQAGRGLAAAHSAGILHRDFKPDNVIVSVDGRARVLDFGLARAVECNGAAESSGEHRALKDNAAHFELLGAALTETGRFIGTPAYMAPEQLMGQPATVASDQFSFCLALYQGLYGELPFKGQSIEALVREMNQGKAPPAVSSQVPSRLRRAVLRGLRPDRADRYPSMDALLDELVLQANRTRRRFLAIAVLGMLGASATVGGVVWKKRNTVQTAVQSIAILPLRNLGDPSEEPFIDSITDALTTTVAQLSNATVISHDSAARYKTSPQSLQEIGRELSIDALVSGSAKRHGSRIQITTELTRVATGRQLWTKSFEYEYGQLPMLQADIAAGLLTEVESQHMRPEQKARLDKSRSIKPEVYEACLKGRLFLNRRNVADIRKGISFFEQAVNEDPGYAPAYVGLADGYRLLAVPATVVPPTEASQLATPPALKALSLDPNLGEAHFILGAIKFGLDLDWRSAEPEFKRAIELDPNHANAHLAYSLFLVDLGRLDEALVEAKRAQRLDPLTALIQVGTAQWFTAAGKYDEAIKEYQRVIELDPNNGTVRYHMANAYHDAGMYQEAFLANQKAFEISHNPAHRLEMAHHLAHLGRLTEAEQILDEGKEFFKRNNPFFVARIYAVLGRKEDALQWLEYAYPLRSLWLIRLNRSRDFDWLRSDARFQDLVRRVGWPQ